MFQGIRCIDPLILRSLFTGFTGFTANTARQADRQTDGRDRLSLLPAVLILENTPSTNNPHSRPDSQDSTRGVSQTAQ